MRGKQKERSSGDSSPQESGRPEERRWKERRLCRGGVKGYEEEEGE